MATVLRKPPTTQDPSVNPNAPPKVAQPTNAPSANGASKGLSSAQKKASSSATQQDQANSAAQNSDWRIKLQLANNANYFYKIATVTDIMYPLTITNGVVFPYIPSITVNYAASYEPLQLTQTNYKIFQYQSSGIDQIQINCDFTAQDPIEAAYVLAVIHFFRSMTKMFYGQDDNPRNGTPPPLCYLTGMGGYQFDKLPLAISSFNYVLPTDVDYVKTSGIQPANTPAGSTATGSSPKEISVQRAETVGAGPGGAPAPTILSKYAATKQAAGVPTTWVPSKINLSIGCVPIISRNDMSNNFSLKDYASGKLLLNTNRSGKGFW